jgi:hypothetical protein
LAARELAGPRGKLKLKSRINTFLSSPLCRDAGELSTSQSEMLEAAVQVHETLAAVVKEQVTSSAEYVRDELLVLCKENRVLLAENEGLEAPGPSGISCGRKRPE